MSTDLRYYGAAAILGAGWFLVLLLSEPHRGWLMDDDGFGTLSLILMTLTGLIVAAIFRRWITSAATLRGDIGRGVVLPYVGCIIYITLLILCHLLASGGSRPGDLLNLYFWGPWISAVYFFIVIPYGIVCQRILRKV